jgi:hypothetical protein
MNTLNSSTVWCLHIVFTHQMVTLVVHGSGMSFGSNTQHVLLLQGAMAVLLRA